MAFVCTPDLSLSLVESVTVDEVMKGRKRDD